jgi:hypothetical protein
MTLTVVIRVFLADALPPGSAINGRSSDPA